LDFNFITIENTEIKECYNLIPYFDIGLLSTQFTVPFNSFTGSFNSHAVFCLSIGSLSAAANGFYQNPSHFKCLLRSVQKSTPIHHFMLVAHVTATSFLALFT
jgi:hypothetical protein